jgi:hypothetical protein
VTKSRFAIVGVFVAETLIIANNPVWLSKDYHTVASLFLCLYCIFIYKFICNEGKKRCLFSIFLGLTTFFLCLIKQNIALVCAISAFTAFFLVRSDYRSVAKNCFFYSLALLIGILFYSSLAGFEWISVYIQNDSKGSPIPVLLRIVLDPNIRIFTFYAVILSIFFVFIQTTFFNMPPVITIFNIGSIIILFILSIKHVSYIGLY